MSRWPTELRALVARWRTRQFGPLHTLFVQPHGVRAWGPAPDAAPHDYPDVPAWAAAHPRCRARLVLSGHLTHQRVVSDPALPLHDSTTLATWARHQWAHYHGPAAQRWPVAAWWLPAIARVSGDADADADAQPQRGACAVHGLDLLALQTQVQTSGCVLVSAQPWWAVALSATSRTQPDLPTQAHALVLLHEGCLVTCMDVAQGCLTALSQRWLPRPDAQALATLKAELLAARPAHTPHWVQGYGLDQTTAPQLLAPERTWVHAA